MEPELKLVSALLFSMRYTFSDSNFTGYKSYLVITTTTTTTIIIIIIIIIIIRF